VGEAAGRADVQQPAQSGRPTFAALLPSLVEPGIRAALADRPNRARSPGHGRRRERQAAQFRSRAKIGIGPAATAEAARQAPRESSRRLLLQGSRKSIAIRAAVRLGSGHCGTQR